MLGRMKIQTAASAVAVAATLSFMGFRVSGPTSERLETERYQAVSIGTASSVKTIMIDTATGEWRPFNPYVAGTWSDAAPKKK